jgi:hypothetical protein
VNQKTNLDKNQINVDILLKKKKLNDFFISPVNFREALSNIFANRVRSIANPLACASQAAPSFENYLQHFSF